jgi:iron complex outermembrane receptor protein
MTAVPVDGLELDASVALLHSEFTNFKTFDPTIFDPSTGNFKAVDLSGNRLPFTPTYTLSYGAQYTWDTSLGPITLRADGRTLSDVFYDQFNKPINSAGSSTILNASLGWKDINDRVSVTAFVRNMTDELYLNGTFMNGGAIGYTLDGSYDPPRTYGVQLGVKF